MQKFEKDIPEREKWLYDNLVALKMVQTGLLQAKSRQYSKNPPNLDEDLLLIDLMDKSEV